MINRSFKKTIADLHYTNLGTQLIIDHQGCRQTRSLYNKGIKVCNECASLNTLESMHCKYCKAEIFCEVINDPK